MASVGENRFSAEFLFPERKDAVSDDKCVLIATVINQLCQSTTREYTTEELRENARKRYQYLVTPERITLFDADHRACLLYQSGVNSEVAKRYYSIRLSNADASAWHVTIQK